MERSRYEEMSIEELEKEAESTGDINIMDLLSHIYSLGDDRWETDQDPVKAVYWMKKMAEAGNPTGMFNLALHYAKGYGTEQSFEKAADWMEKAAEAGDEDAKENAKVLREAAEAYPKAKAGDVHAQAVMAKYYMTCANMLEESNTEEEYYAKALECAKASAAQNDTLGIYILALAYDKGRGVAEDVAKGLELYRKGAELGGVECLQNLAYAYLAGRGVKQDAVKGQAFVTIAMTFSNLLSSLLGGVLIRIIGVTPALWFGTLVTFAGVVIAIFGLAKICENN
jgi:TPR repeat protein